MKHKVFLCEACLACVDPQIHCKYRDGCPIWFRVKRGGDRIDEE